MWGACSRTCGGGTRACTVSSVGYFGFFACADDLEAAGALLEAAVAFARENGCHRLRGPFDMTAAQEMGLLTSGFEHPPAVDMVHTPPWYPRLFESIGFRVCLRMVTWRNPDAAALDADAMLAVKRGSAGPRIDVRPIRSHRRDEDMEHVRELINASFLGNWCFVPITREEWRLQVGTLVPLLDPELVLLAEVEGVPVGVTFAVPDFNHVIRRLDGALIRPGALGFLRRPPAPDAVVILFAVRKAYQGMGVSRMLNAALVRALRRGGYRGLSITWVATDNAASLAQAKALGMRLLHELADGRARDLTWNGSTPTCSTPRAARPPLTTRSPWRLSLFADRLEVRLPRERLLPAADTSSNDALHAVGALLENLLITFAQLDQEASYRTAARLEPGAPVVSLGWRPATSPRPDPTLYRMIPVRRTSRLPYRPDRSPTTPWPR
jgi:GNAT superfamily N-acetyltransferase